MWMEARAGAGNLGTSHPGPDLWMEQVRDSGSPRNKGRSAVGLGPRENWDSNGLQ